jgi:hypothetical protein
VRSALELGHSNEVMHGVDPLRENPTDNKWLLMVLMAVYKGKTALTGFLLKVGLKRFASRDVIKYGAPYMAIPATMLWNSLIALNVMNEAKLRCVGISAGIELFEAVLRHAAAEASSQRAAAEANGLSHTFKLQLLRAIAAPLTRRRRLYATQEVLLKHAVHTLHMASEVDHTEGVVDSADDLLLDMGKLTMAEQGQVLQVFVLTAILDGSFTKKEARFYTELCDAADAQFDPQVRFVILPHASEARRVAQCCGVKWAIRRADRLHPLHSPTAAEHPAGRVHGPATLRLLGGWRRRARAVVRLLRPGVCPSLLQPLRLLAAPSNVNSNRVYDAATLVLSLAWRMLGLVG